MNSFGRFFRVSIFGESHGPMVGVTIDGCPAGLKLEAEDFAADLARRQGGAIGTTARRDPDLPIFQSGIVEGRTTGAPLSICFENRDVDSSAYEELKKKPRPGHADLAARIKYGGWNDARGSGHFSGRLTVGLVAAGAIAKKLIAPIAVRAELVEVGGAEDIPLIVKQVAEKGDSVGGLIACSCEHVPAGLGEPFFDSVESVLAHLLFGIPGVKGVEFGAGFTAARMLGSAFNDQIADVQGHTATNNAGGISGGITNGNELFFRVAVRPPASISLPQQTVNLETGKQEVLTVEGRHDACIALRAPVVVEALTAIALCDLLAVEGRLPRIKE